MIGKKIPAPRHNPPAIRQRPRITKTAAAHPESMM
jgi:hypothetical protein